jgi:hypothetical protein
VGDLNDGDSEGPDVSFDVVARLLFDDLSSWLRTNFKIN